MDIELRCVSSAALMSLFFKICVRQISPRTCSKSRTGNFQTTDAACIHVLEGRHINRKTSVETWLNNLAVLRGCCNTLGERFCAWGGWKRASRESQSRIMNQGFKIYQHWHARFIWSQGVVGLWPTGLRIFPSAQTSSIWILAGMSWRGSQKVEISAYACLSPRWHYTAFWIWHRR